MPFFVIVATLYLMKRQEISGVAGQVFKAVIFLATLISVCYFIPKEKHNLRAFFHNGAAIDGQYPVKSADFVLENNLTGPIFNTFPWGSYLIWRLGPERRVFTDQRQLEPGRYWEAASSYADAYRKELFLKYDIRIAMLPLFLPSEEMSPLVASLLEDKNWALVFKEDNVGVFIRADKANSLGGGKR